GLSPFALSFVHLVPHSFPTRRSSDLRKELARGGRGARGRCLPDCPARHGVAPHGHGHVPAVVVAGHAATCRGRFSGDGTRCRRRDRKSTRLNSSHVSNSYAVFCLKTQ